MRYTTQDLASNAQRFRRDLFAWLHAHGVDTSDGVRFEFGEEHPLVAVVADAIAAMRTLQSLADEHLANLPEGDPDQQATRVTYARNLAAVDDRVPMDKVAELWQQLPPWEEWNASRQGRE